MRLVLLLVLYVLVFYGIQTAPPTPRYEWWKKEKS